MIISNGNRIKSRLYDLTILKDGVIVNHEYGLTARERNTYSAEYRKEGFQVNSEETFSVTANHKLVGETPINNDVPDRQVSKFTPGTASATENRINAQRMQARQIAAKKNVKTNVNTTVRRGTNGRDKNSPMHDMFIESLKRDGYKVHNLVTNKFFYGMQGEVVRYLDKKINKQGYKITDFKVKYIGQKGK